MKIAQDYDDGCGFICDYKYRIRRGGMRNRAVWVVDFAKSFLLQRESANLSAPLATSFRKC